jgi:formate dehydrogenase major subunit
MATKDTGQSLGGMTRRTFVKSAAVAGAVAGCGFDVAYNAEKALAYENSPLVYKVTTTTCPYCSASCGQRVVTTVGANPTVVDIYGDFESPMNSGGLCAKGAGSIQLVTNPRRIGAWPAHDNPVFAANTTTYPNGVAYKRTGNGAWGAMDLQTALSDIASNATYGLVASRGALTDAAGYNSKGVAFLGSSHMNNEPNYLYRKLIANFGTSNTEHQARI